MTVHCIHFFREIDVQIRKAFSVKSYNGKFREINDITNFFSFQFDDFFPLRKNTFWFQSHSVEKREILSHQKCTSSNQLFSNLFSKTVSFTKFLSKMREREFPQFPQCAGITRNSLFPGELPRKIFFRQINIPKISLFSETLIWRNED